jgi:colicin import membrane protein
MSEHDVLSRLRTASRAEAPRDGAKARAVSAGLVELRVAPVARQARRVSAILSATGIVLFMALVGGGLFIKHQNDEQAAADAQHAAEVATQKAAMDKLMAELNEQNASVAALFSAIQNAKDDAQRAVAQQQLAQVRRAAEATKSAIRGAGSVNSAAGSPKKACNCQPGDPLCSCIP